MPTREEILSALKSVFDPELGINVVELGLIYDVQASNGDVKIKMTMTSLMCPAAASIMEQCRAAVQKLSGVSSCEAELVWDPPWSPERMSEDARMKLGFI